MIRIGVAIAYTQTKTKRRFPKLVHIVYYETNSTRSQYHNKTINTGTVKIGLVDTWTTIHARTDAAATIYYYFVFVSFKLTDIAVITTYFRKENKKIAH